MTEKYWTDERLEAAKLALTKSRTLAEASALIGVTPAALYHGLVRYRGIRPDSLLAKERDTMLPPAEGRFDALIAETRNPRAFESLCDALNLSPAAARKLIAEARDSGLAIRTGTEHVSLGVEVRDDVVVSVPPVIGERQFVGVLSDPHAGSKYFLRAQAKDFVHRAYEQGCRTILIPGDLVDGTYKHGVFELSHVGLDDQTDDLLRTLPERDGLTYRFITGNHDETITASSGLDVGRFVEGRARDLGRKDFQNLGCRSAFIEYGGTRIHLWHPKKTCGYAVSYGIQKQVEKYSSGIKPGILLIGHWHRHASIYERGVHAISCPTFQSGESSFAKSLGGQPSIGGLILSWRLTETKTIRSFRQEFVSYFVKEQVREVTDA
jgi:hypothetical protein